MNGDKESIYVDIEIPRLSTIRHPGGDGLTHYLRLRLRNDLLPCLDIPPEDAFEREIDVDPSDIRLDELTIEPSRIAIEYSYVYNVFYGCSDIEPMNEGSGRIEGIRLLNSRFWRFTRVLGEAPSL